MKRFVNLTFVMMLAFIVILSGCSSSSSINESKNNNSGEGSKPLNVALIVKSVDSEYWLTVKAGAEKAAKELGVNLIFKGAPTETDIAGQISIVENAINQRMDGIVLAASDTKALVAPVEKAIDAGIPVVTVDSGIDSDKPQSFIATDNEKAAEEAAKVLAEMTGKKGKVAVVNFVPGAATAVMRENGFKDGIKKYPDMKIVAIQYSQSDKAKALSVTEDILTAHPDIVGIFGANNKSALGAAQAIKQKGLEDKVHLVAFDADPDEINELKKGTIKALIVQNPFKMGYEGVKNVVKAIKGEQVEKRIDTGVTVVTKDNFNDPEVQKLLFPNK
ncbi:ABC transporter substrate-binding protein [Parageobacillus sp. VR-IP]|uniref:ABC transporter substrate-binding protein n=1 Tax=Parageobacillus sp. VR-IP TaxID=2742205 RepID=UPI001582D30C|nr:ABC transporter substrate-binding protein [Parageobacillus sp. VR-IP]NUK28822.1 ABC transporter substrate-binding protein [Parageobacillus sp. VR-IP]